MNARKRRSERIGKLLFFIPMIVIISVVVYGVIIITTPGTLNVRAQADNPYISGSALNPPQLHVSATVTGSSGTRSVTTPGSLSLGSGTYTVVYGPLPWYKTPPAKVIGVPNGQTVYAVAVYDVVPTVVSITSSGFNATQVTALHQVTPVIWINNSGSDVQLGVSGLGNYPLAPGQNATGVFQKSGSFTFSVGTDSGTLQVS